MNHLLKLLDCTSEEIVSILDLADQLKYEKKHGIAHRHLEGKSIGLIFQKSSTRTRVSFETGIYQLGGQPLFLSARDLEEDVLKGYDLGADDYVTKPFSPAELTARVDALFRRAGGDVEEVPEGEIRKDPFLLNTRNRTLEKNGQRIKLTQVEYSIIKLFMDNPGKALSREEILDSVWGRDYFGEVKIVDVNIRRLRLKIEDNPQNPTYITTVWGYGYKWGF